MNDLTQLQDFGRELDHDLTELSPAVRNRILSSFEPYSWRARWLPQARQNTARRRRLPIPVTVLTMLTAVVICLTALGFWGGTPAADAQAVRILDRAASAALRQPTPHIRPSDFVFTRVLEMAATITMRYHRHPLVSEHTVLGERWLSASGRRKGLLRERRFSIALGHPTGPWNTTVLQACIHGHLVPRGPVGYSQGGITSAPCHAIPADLRHLPTTEPAMRRYIYHHLDGQNPLDQQAFITAGDLIRDNYIRPAALAAIFRAVAHIPGVTVVHGAVSANGRRGIAVQRIYHGISDQLIFDPETYSVIGEREVVVGPGTGLKVGTIMDLTTILAMRIVHNVGQAR
jgi:hypothetical protein